MKQIVNNFCELPRAIRPSLWNFWHFVMHKLDKDQSSVFLNYGYASKNGEFKNLKLDPSDEPNRYGIQLYHYVTKYLEFDNAKILEVGSGRGGGASWLAKVRKPETYIGIDISESAISFCNNFFNTTCLSFIRGKAEKIPFPNDKFDAVINIESARCYGNITGFFKEVSRVLRQGGHFSFADMIKNKDVPVIEESLLKIGFKLLHKENITENIVLALKADSNSKKKIIDQRVPGFMRNAFYEFAGIEGTDRFNIFLNDEIQYWNFILQNE